MKEPTDTFLYWRDAQGGVSQRNRIELLKDCLCERVIRSTFKLSVETRVYLNIDGFCTTGLIASCQPDGHGYFLLKIQASQEQCKALASEVIDPGVFNVESFLTREQEETLLEDLSRKGGETEPSSSRRSSG